MDLSSLLLLHREQATIVLVKAIYTSASHKHCKFAFAVDWTKKRGRQKRL